MALWLFPEHFGRPVSNTKSSPETTYYVSCGTLKFKPYSLSPNNKNGIDVVIVMGLCQSNLGIHV